MAKFLRYRGEFLSRAGVVWRVEILQESDQTFASVGTLEFDANDALVIDWNNADKENVICGSTATLQILSPGDRTYEDLYTIAPGQIRMDVYRNGSLYWSGALDPEFYEEPYERYNNYTVVLTFSDFGILDRLKYDLSGMRTLREIVDNCIRRSTIKTSLDETLISTGLTPDGGKMSLSDLKVRSDNFYDEDGEALTLKEVIEGILQPLALRMVQRAGRVYIYDLNALYHASRSKSVVWDGDSQTLSADRVYNNAKITWSTYAQSGNLSVSECWTLPTDINETALNIVNGRTIGDSVIYSYYYNNDHAAWGDSTNCGFTIWTSDIGKNAAILMPRSKVKYYKIVPQYDGSESEGIAIHWPGVHVPLRDLGRVDWVKNGLSPEEIKGTTKAVGSPIFGTPPVWIPPVSDASGLLIRVAMDMLMDPRFNPFEGAEKWPSVDQKDWEEKWNGRGNFMYIPVLVKFKPTGSTDIYCWSNVDIIQQNSSPQNGRRVLTLVDTYGKWQKDTSGNGKQNVWGYLAYYSPDDRAAKSGVVGWHKNRPAINPHLGKITALLEKSEDGQYLPYPNFGAAGGELWVEICTGWVLSDGGINVPVDEVFDTWGLWDKFCWILCQIPEIEIMNSYQYEKSINTDDVEYNAEINAAAKEDIEIDTICGSSVEGVPTARGAYFSSYTGKQITELTRAGRTSQIEDLLIGTLFSQFGSRRTKLSGDMQILDHALSAYTEQNQEGKKFVAVADQQNVIMDISNVTITELRPDEYKKI